MRIVCPDCGFERELNPSQVPATAVMATCPQCKVRFRFRSLEAPPLPFEDLSRTRPPMLSDLAEADEPDGASYDRSGGTPEQTAAEQPAPSFRASRGSTNQDTQVNQAKQASPEDQEGDDPLPPGAFVPNRPRDAAYGTGAEKNADDPSRTASQAGGQAGHSGQPGQLGQPSQAKHDSPAPSARAARQDLSPEDKRALDAANSASEANEAHESDSSQSPRAAWDARSLFSGTGSSEVPWEQAPPAELAAAWYQTMLRVLFSAPAFFSAVGASRAGLVRPCLFFVLLGTFQSVVDHLWFMSRLTEWAAMQDANVQAGITAFAQELNLPVLVLLMPLMLLLQLLFYSSLFNLMIRLIQPEKADLITTIRVVAYSAAPGVLSLVPVVGTQVAGLWFAICCFIGCKHAFNLSWPRTALAILPLYVLGLALSLHATRMLMSLAQ